MTPTAAPPPISVFVRPTKRRDFPGIVALCASVYSGRPWREDQLESHLKVFPEGQLVAVDPDTKRIVGMAASLIVLWDDYHMDVSWAGITDSGMFTNHDPEGHTLYGAEVMTDPSLRRRGIGKALYAARRNLARRLKLLRIRAGARLRGYHQYADRMSPDDYVTEIVKGNLHDPTLTFQLRQRFRVIAVVEDYLKRDPESLGYAAVIEWVNHKVAKKRDYVERPRRFLPKVDK